MLQVWRVIDAGLCTLLETQTLYSIEDIEDMSLFLDYKDARGDEAKERQRDNK